MTLDDDLFVPRDLAVAELGRSMEQRDAYIFVAPQCEASLEIACRYLDGLNDWTLYVDADTDFESILKLDSSLLVSRDALDAISDQQSASGQSWGVILVIPKHTNLW